MIYGRNAAAWIEMNRSMSSSFGRLAFAGMIALASCHAANGQAPFDPPAAEVLTEAQAIVQGMIAKTDAGRARAIADSSYARGAPRANSPASTIRSGGRSLI
jgi:hypothetical protein